MLDFEDELTLESFRIPWLIWIQLIVLFLLLLFLFCFTIIASDPSHSHDTSASSSTIQSLANHHSSTAVTVTNPLHIITRGVENLSIKGEIATSASTEIVREEIAEGEASSSLYFLHPCYYFKLAIAAFLKCLGLDSASDFKNPSIQKHEKKNKES